MRIHLFSLVWRGVVCIYIRVHMHSMYTYFCIYVWICTYLYVQIGNSVWDVGGDVEVIDEASFPLSREAYMYIHLYVYTSFIYVYTSFPLERCSMYMHMCVCVFKMNSM
jgi:hypothetical protein